MQEQSKHIQTMTVYLAGKTTDEAGITSYFAEIIGGKQDGRRIIIVNKPWNWALECRNHEEKPE